MANISVGTKRTRFILCHNCRIAELLEIMATLNMMIYNFLRLFVWIILFSILNIPTRLWKRWEKEHYPCLSCEDSCAVSRKVRWLSRFGMWIISQGSFERRNYPSAIQTQWVGWRGRLCDMTTLRWSRSWGQTPRRNGWYRILTQCSQAESSRLTPHGFLSPIWHCFWNLFLWYFVCFLD